MPTCTIETHRMEDGTYRGYVVDGPGWLHGWWSQGETREATYSSAASGVRGMLPTRQFTFLHATT